MSGVRVGRLPALPINIRLCCELLKLTNIVAYYTNDLDFFRLEFIRVEPPIGLHAMGKLPAFLTLISTVAYNHTE
jgi:hypothetical protein